MALSSLIVLLFVLASGLVRSTPAVASTGLSEVHFSGYSISVPDSWPVYHLGKDPRQCVRFDQHAVYLGTPGPVEDCPAHVVGRTEAILVEPLNQAEGAEVAQGETTAGLGQVVPPSWPSLDAGQIVLAAPSAGVLVTATWREDPELVKSVLGRARLVATASTSGGSGGAGSALASNSASGQPSTLLTDPIFTGKGFDACTAPSTSTMSTWLSSPYRAIGVYIGGVNRACTQANLTASWVGTETGAGWSLVPTYVGLQAPVNSCQCAPMDPSQASVQGAAAANDAVSEAAALGMGTGSPIYYDMEAYAQGSTNTPPVLAFLSAWTTQLHAHGYLSGVYSSGASGISDLVSQYGTGYQEPDDIWVANWNGQATTSDPYLPAGDWTNHQRIHQYQGGHNETYGGITINIDNDYLDASVVTANPGALPVHRLAGTDRYDTARIIAQQTFPTGASNAVIASGLNFPDALAGNYLAGVLNGPVLLTDPASLSAATSSALSALHVSHAYILGGTDAVSQGVQDQITAMGISTTRLGGATRYDTMQMVNTFNPAKVGTAGGSKTAVLATGNDFPDALAGGPLGFARNFPIVLTDGTQSTLTPQAQQTLATDGVTHLIVLGGSNALNPAQYTGGPFTTDVQGGADRSQTSQLLADDMLANLGFSNSHFNIANGANFPDALAGGPHSGSEKAPILITMDPNTPGSATTFAGEHKATEADAHAFGGTTALSDATLSSISAAS